MMSGTKHATLLLYKPGEVHCGMLFYCDISTSGMLFYAQAKALVTDVVLLYSMFAHSPSICSYQHAAARHGLLVACFIGL